MESSGREGEEEEGKGGRGGQGEPATSSPTAGAARYTFLLFLLLLFTAHESKQRHDWIYIALRPRGWYTDSHALLPPSPNPTKIFPSLQKTREIETVPLALNDNIFAKSMVLPGNNDYLKPTPLTTPSLPDPMTTPYTLTLQEASPTSKLPQMKNAHHKVCKDIDCDVRQFFPPKRASASPRPIPLPSVPRGLSCRAAGARFMG